MKGLIFLISLGDYYLMFGKMMNKIGEKDLDELLRICWEVGEILGERDE